MLIEQHEASAGPLYMYIAPQNVHLGCGPDKATQGIQAPCETVAREPPRHRWLGCLLPKEPARSMRTGYPTVSTDQFKVQSAVTTELDYVVSSLIDSRRSFSAPLSLSACSQRCC